MRLIHSLSVLLGLLVLTGGAEAQYTYLKTTSTTAPYFERTRGKPILLPVSDQALTTWQVLPFPWTFYGETVTGYYASDNGYITFDSLAATSVSSNDLPPTATGPNKAIYALWDSWRLLNVSGGFGRIQSWTYGREPNRVHVVQWYNTSPASGPGLVHFSIRLYECGEFDILNTFDSHSSTSATIGCENSDGTQATTVTGSPNHQGGGGTSAINSSDDIVYRFTWNSPAALDARLLRLDLPPSIGVGSDLIISGAFENKSVTQVTSIDVSYSVNGSPAVTQSFTSLSIDTGKAYVFTLATPYTVSSTGHLAVKAWIHNINGGGFTPGCDDTLTTVVAALTGTSGTKRPLMEEYTGAWCQYCPDGKYLLDSLEAQHPDLVIASIHAGGGASYPMEFPGGLDLTSVFCPFYPAGAIDRIFHAGETHVAYDRELWHARAAQQYASLTPLDLNIETTFETTSRMLDVTVRGHFVNYAAQDLVVNVYVTEDSVVGPNSIGYNQVNYYNNVPGHPYYGAGDPIIGYVHRNVLRAIPTNYWGDASVIQFDPAPGDTFRVNYASIPISAEWDADQIHVLAFVSYNNSDMKKRQVLNASELRMYDGTVVTSINDAGEKPARFELLGNFPNPFNPMTEIRYLLPQASDVSLKIFNMLGQKVRTLVQDHETAGMKTVVWDGKDETGREVSSGVYLYRLESGRQSFTKKMLLIK